MPVFIQHIATVVPETSYSQAEAGEVMLRQIDPESRGGRLTRRIYRDSGIEKRHSVIQDLARNGKPNQTSTKDDEKGEENLFFDASDSRYLSPSTGTRNTVYSKEARKLFSTAARDALSGCQDLEASEVTHVITVSCTGFFAPGPDFYIVKDLDLKPSVERFHIGFMGCYAAFPAMKMARAFCQADPDAVVLVVCLELCSIHIEPSEEIDSILACSVFADGAAGMIISSRAPTSGRALEIERLDSTVTPDSESDMAWTVGDTGFDMVLSTYVPKILEANVEAIFNRVLQAGGRELSDIKRWAIHPGGRAILDKVSAGLNLRGDELYASREILRQYGNMSSATILFVLDEILNSPSSSEKETIFAMAFGPGLTVESALLTRV